MNEHTQELLDELEVDIKPSDLVFDLSPSQQQLVEIAKALSQNVRILILDEPTSSLTVSEARQLFRILRQQAERGVAVVYVSHRLAEVFEIADRVTVLRDGRVTGVRNIGETTADELIRLEVGRALSFVPEPIPDLSEARYLLDIQHLVVPPVRGATVKVRSGEIVTRGGLVGATCWAEGERPSSRNRHAARGFRAPPEFQTQRRRSRGVAELSPHCGIG